MEHLFPVRYASVTSVRMIDRCGLQVKKILFVLVVSVLGTVEVSFRCDIRESNFPEYKRWSISSL